MTHSKKSKLLFAFGVGCIALSYALRMFVGTNEPERMPMTFPSILAAPIGAFAFAALCWYVVIEKLNFHGKLIGALIGIVSGWSIFASALLAAFATGILTEGESFRTIEALVLQVKLALGIGPLFLIMAWGWIPLLLCVILGCWLNFFLGGVLEDVEHNSLEQMN